MRPIKEAHPHVSVFISHASEDNDEAKDYQDILNHEGFNVWQYGRSLAPGDEIDASVESEIRYRHFFLFIVSEHSLAKPFVQREVGLARDVRKLFRGYRPLIIPILSNKRQWSSDNIPAIFPTRNFRTGKQTRGLPFTVRGLNKYGQPTADSDEVLISYMRPSLIISRIHFHSEDTFDDAEVFTLYNDLFPEEERDDTRDIVRWVLRSDLGKSRTVEVANEIKFEYKLDSRYCILLLANKAIGLSFLTYDYKFRIMYGNYIAIQENWRSYGLADAFLGKIEQVFKEEKLFNDCRGIVFEVETFKSTDVDRIISYLEKPRGKRRFRTQEDEQPN